MAQPTYALLILDGSSYLFRSYHALPKLTNARGEPTGALVGVLNMIQKLRDQYQPTHVAVVFDAPGKTFRHEYDPEYKANRPALPEDLRRQIEPLKAILQALGLRLLEVPGVEADDVIGTLAQRAAAGGLQTLIATGDKDLAQVVTDRIHLLDPRADRPLDPAGVEEKFGVSPEQILDYLSLVGDRSDHIPGVPGWGPKRAKTWLGRYGHLDALLERSDAIPGALGASLRNHREQLARVQPLIRLRTDLALPIASLEDLRPEEPDTESLGTWYRRFELNRLLANLPDGEAEAKPPVPCEIIRTPEAFDAWLAQLAAGEAFALHLETAGPDPRTARLVGIALCLSPERAAYLPLLDAPDEPAESQGHRILARIRSLLADPTKAAISAHWKEDGHALMNRGIPVRGPIQDIALESYVLDSTASRHGLHDLALKYLGQGIPPAENAGGKRTDRRRARGTDLEATASQGAERAAVVLALHRVFWPRLARKPRLKTLYQNLEIPLVPVLMRMERAGVRIDPDRLAAQSRRLAGRLQGLEQAAWDAAGHPFNLNSPKQIGTILFQEQGLPVVAKTPKGAPSTSESVLQTLADQGHALAHLILDYRRLAKLKSTYLDALPKRIDPKTGRVHTAYHQAVTATGRLSSSDPNLQNIPIRTEEGRHIRRAFVPDPDHRLIAADYSQIELRILAHLSGDEGLLTAFAQGLDIHRATAAEVWDRPLHRVTDAQRRAAKAIQFGILYGMSAFGLASQIGTSREEAQNYIDRYFQRYPKVYDCLERIRNQARERGFVETLFGRRLYLRDIDRSNHARRAAAERAAINAPMQGTAADIIKRAMIAVDAWIQDQAPQVRMILQVHDELVCEAPASCATEAAQAIRTHMASAASLAVPLVVDVGIGTDWEAAH